MKWIPAALVLCAGWTVGAQAPDERPRIAKESDLPRFTYPVNGGTADVLLLPTPQFLAFAQRVRADQAKVEATYKIKDHATEAAMLATEMNILMIEGGHDREALAMVQRVRSLQDKPAEKLTSELGAEVFLRARLAGGAGGATAASGCPKAESAVYAEALRGLPWETVSPAVMELRMRNQVVSQPFLIGMTDAETGPTLRSSMRFRSPPRRW